MIGPPSMQRRPGGPPPKPLHLKGQIDQEEGGKASLLLGMVIVLVILIVLFV